MADIAVTATDVRAVEVWEAFTGPALEAMDAGCPVYLDANGKWGKADANAGDASAVLIGIAMNTITYAGQTLTVMCQGLIDLGDGFTGAAYGTPIYLSNNVGRIATDVTASMVGRVFPAWGAVTPADKVLRVNT